MFKRKYRKYLIFSEPIINKELHNDKKITYKLKFINCFRFISSSLSSLVNNLSEIYSKKCRYKNCKSECGFKGIIWFSRSVLYFDTYACFIPSVLYGAYKIIRAIDLLFNSHLFQSFWCDGKLIFFQLYWSIKGLIFDILCGLFLMF